MWKNVPPWQMAEILVDVDPDPVAIADEEQAITLAMSSKNFIFFSEEKPRILICLNWICLKQSAQLFIWVHPEFRNNRWREEVETLRKQLREQNVVQTLIIFSRGPKHARLCRLLGAKAIGLAPSIWIANEETLVFSWEL